MIVVGDCREMLATMDAESVDAVVTDPPYELAFMGREWDRRGVAFDPETWRAVLRVMRPGAPLLAFGGTRTWHRLAVAIEDAGFQIVDTIMWLHGQGFPKHKTLLKPGWEPVIVAKKPGTGGLQTDACRIGNGGDRTSGGPSGMSAVAGGGWSGGRVNASTGGERATGGRWPANVVLSHLPECVEVGVRRVKGDGHYPKARGESGYQGGWGGQDDLDERYTNGETVAAWDCARDETGAYLCPVAMLDQQSGERRSAGHYPSNQGKPGHGWGNVGKEQGPLYADSGGSSRFFATFPPDDAATRFLYCPKASRAEREMGLDGLPLRPPGAMEGTHDGSLLTGSGNPRNNLYRNTHPTVKPLALMRWLVRLVTPPGGTVLDPFLGSGTTLMACELEGFSGIGIEQDESYAEIARRRLANVAPRQLAMVAD